MIFWLKTSASVVAALSVLTGVGWGSSEYIHNNIPSKEELSKVQDETLVAGAKADYVLERQMEGLIAQIKNLESKRRRTREEQSQLDYLRKQLDLMRQIRRGK